MTTKGYTDEGAAELTTLMAETKERWRRTAEFADLVDEYEQVTRCHVDELEDAVDAQYEVGLTHPDYWLRWLRRMGEAVTRSPSLIQCAEAPEGSEELVRLYESWAGVCEKLGANVLRWVEAIEDGEYHQASDWRDEVNMSLAATQAHTSVRTICLPSLGVKSSAALYYVPEPTPWVYPFSGCSGVVGRRAASS